MSDTSKPNNPKRSRKIALASLALAIVGSAGGFAAMYFDALKFVNSSASADPKAQEYPTEMFSYIPIEPLNATISNGNDRFQLRFSAQLEVNKGNEDHVSFLMPRIVDVLNTYLRAIEPDDFTDEFTLIRLRSHVLHRINLVVGEDAVRDVMITEFILT